MDVKRRAYILDAATGFYQRSLKGKARKYLERKRGLTPETIKQFRIGYAPAKPGLLRYLRKQDVRTREAVKAGLFGTRNSGLRQFFRNRIIFPVIRRGKVLNLIGRELPGGKDD
jgi:DNA primase